MDIRLSSSFSVSNVATLDYYSMRFHEFNVSWFSRAAGKGF